MKRKFFSMIAFTGMLLQSWGATPISSIEGLGEGDHFEIASRLFRWDGDLTGNGMIDPSEASESTDGGQSWATIDTDAYDNCIDWRRLRRFDPEKAYVYKTVDNRELSLYVHYPTDWQPTDSRPAIVWFFGGAWSVGDPLQFRPKAEYFAERGLVSIRVDYRVYQRDRLGDSDAVATMDAKSAMRWVRKNAAILGIDINKVLAGGGSAGGHLALATWVDDAQVNDPNDDVSISAKADAFILENPFVPVPPTNPASVWPVLTQSPPPMWIAYGTADTGAYITDSEYDGSNYIVTAQAEGVDVTTYIVEGAGHGFCSGPYLTPSTAEIDAFLVAKGFLSGTSGTLPTKTYSTMRAELRASIAAGTADMAEPNYGQSINNASLVESVTAPQTVDSNLVVHFAYDMNPATIASGITVSNQTASAAVAGSWSNSDARTFTFAPSVGYVASNEYAVVMNANLADTEGNTQVIERDAHFRPDGESDDADIWARLGTVTEEPATVYTWTSTSSTDWSDGANWDGGVAPTSLTEAGTTSDSFVFSGTVMPTLNIPNYGSGFDDTLPMTLNSGGTMTLDFSSSFNSSLWANASRTQFTVGDGVNAVTLNINNMSFFARNAFTSTFLVNQGSLLNINGNLNEYPDADVNKKGVFNLNGGSMVVDGQAGIQNGVGQWSGNTSFTFSDLGGSVTMDFGGNIYASLTDVTDDFGTVFQSDLGVSALSAVDNQDGTFTVSASVSPSATTLHWFGTGDGVHWGDAANWDLGRIPGAYAADSAFIQGGATVTVATNAPSSFVIPSLVVRHTEAEGSTLNIAADLPSITDMWIGAANDWAGFVNQSAGTVDVTGLQLGAAAGLSSSYTLSGGTLAVVTPTVAASGTMILNGGEATVQTLNMNGVLDINGGTFTIDNDDANDKVSGTGLIKVRSGTLQTTAAVATRNDAYECAIEVSGGTVNIGHQVYYTGGLTVIGDAATLNIDHYSGGSKFTFEMGASGISTIDGTGSWGHLGWASITVDGSAYTGGSASFTLFKSSNLASTSTDVTVTGFADGVTAEVTQDVDDNNMVILTIAVPGFSSWVLDYDLSGNDALETADVDSDGFNNLMEYALGGNPTINDASAIAPVSFMAEDGGTNWFYYVHNERTDDESLDYTLGTETDLVNAAPVWNTNDVFFVSESAAVNNIKSVTNRTEVVGGAKFIRLTVEK